MYGHGDLLCCQKGPSIHTGMETLCTCKKASIYGHADTLQWEKGPCICAKRHFALAKSSLFWGMETLCISKKALIHRQKGLCIWA